MKYFIYILLLGGTLFAFSCEKGTVELEYTDVINDSEFKPSIVIRGSITSEEKYHTVLLYTSVSYTEQSISDISNATVYLEVNGKTYPYIESIHHPNYPEDKKNKGTYVSVNKIKGKPHYIHTIYAEINNTTYSASDYMTESSYFEFTKDITPYAWISTGYFRDAGGEVTDTSLSTGRIFFNQIESFIIEWKMKSEDRYTGFIYESKPNHAFYFDRIESQQIMNDCFLYNTNELYRNKDSIVTAKKLSISKAYNQYLYEVFKETVWNASDFATTPANISTNVTNGGIGFFSAHDVYKKTITYGNLLDIAFLYNNVIDDTNNIEDP